MCGSKPMMYLILHPIIKQFTRKGIRTRTTHGEDAQNVFKATIQGGREEGLKKAVGIRNLHAQH